MAETAYPYDVAADFPGGKVNIGTLQTEIQASAIVTAIERIDTVGGTMSFGQLVGGSVSVVFKAALSVGDKTILDGDATGPAGGLIAAHDNSQAHPGPLMREDGVAYAVPKAASYGLEMCDRDFRINTGQFASADSLEDVKVDPATLLETPWGELSQVGVYKDVSGAMTPCVDQADVDANGILSVWDYTAKLGGTPIRWEVRDGAIYVDPAIHAAPDAPTVSERFGHRVYAVFAPDIPGGSGGSVAVFDGYMGSSKGLKVVALSPQASVLDPAGPAGPAGSVVRIFLYYPVGTKLSHVMRLVTYRALGTF
jgi:hypothetical protein